MSTLSQDRFHNEEAAYDYVQARLWPNGPVCPHCGETDRVNKLKGKSTRIGVHKCYSCKKPFTVKIGTIFEQSHVKMNLWLQAIFLMASSKKGISSNQLHRTLGVTLKTAWFMSHRIREAMRSGSLEPLGGNGEVVEADETYYGKRDVQAVSDQRKGRPYFSVFKRGIYQHCKEKHLHRYLAEFDFRHNHRIAPGADDVARAESMLLNVKGKRLTYQTTD